MISNTTSIEITFRFFVGRSKMNDCFRVARIDIRFQLVEKDGRMADIDSRNVPNWDATSDE